MADAVDSLLAIGPALLFFFFVFSGADPHATSFVERTIEMIAFAPWTAVITILISAVLHTVHHVVVMPRLSTTVGGALMGLRVRVRSSGAGPSLLRAATRGVLSSLGVILFGVGPLYAYWLDKNRRGLGDLGTRMLVLKREGE